MTDIRKITTLPSLWLAILMVAIYLATSLGVSQSALASRSDRAHVYVSAHETKRRIIIGLDKSVIVHLPRAARDVLVSNPKKLGAVVRSANMSYLIGKEIGQTNVFYFDAAGRQILSLEVRIERDLAGLKSMYRRLLPSSKIGVEAINDTVVITGSVANASQSKQAADIAQRLVGKPEQVLNMLSIRGKEQVLLRVRIVEMQRTTLKQLGVDLSATFDIGAKAFNLATVNPFSLLGTTLSNTLFAGGYQKGDTSVAAVVRAMERNGLLRTLAEPTLTAISGESAKFLAGGEFPVPAGRDRDGNITIEFKPFGVGLAFTPVVLSEGRISMKISTEVSELTTDGAFTVAGSTSAALTIPALKVRRAETTVELPSGGSLVMAGLIQENTKQNLNGVPGVKDLPVLGSLFRSRDYQSSESELVVIVTPYMVNPVARKKLVGPDHKFKQPHDINTFLLGHLNKVYGASGRHAPRGAYRGNIGFIGD